MIYCFSDCVLDTEQHELHRAGELIDVEPKVFKVLVYLLQHKGELVTHDELFEQCWPGMYVSENTLTRCLSRVRRAIGHSNQVRLVETVHRKGYRFIGELTEQSVTETATPADGPAAEAFPPVQPPASDQAPNVAPNVAPDAPPPPPRRADIPTLPQASPERRQLTVLSCHWPVVYGSSADDDDESDIEEQYQHELVFRQQCLQCLAPLGAYLAQSLSDGLVFYFGYPQAFENNARRAVLAALQLLKKMQQAPADAAATVTAQIGIGIHSGTVIVEAAATDRLPMARSAGPTELMAARIARQAYGHGIVISEATTKLINGEFDWQPLSLPTDTGHASSASSLPALFLVNAQHEHRLRFTTDTLASLTPFVGRSAEQALLTERWTQVQEGIGQIVLISGEAGIGKSRLVQRLKHHIVGESYLHLECRSSPYHQSMALFPLLELLQRILQSLALSESASELERIEALVDRYRLPASQTVPLLAGLLSVTLPAGHYPDLSLSSQQQRRHTMQLLLTLLLTQAQSQPLLLILEDLHWADPSTLEFIELLLHQVPAAPLLVTLTCRPEFEPIWSWQVPIAPLRLDRLNRSQIEQMLWHMTGGKTLPVTVISQIMEKTDGVPLFIEELTRMLIESGQLRETTQGFILRTPLEQLSIPLTLQDLLMARLDRLASGKLIAQWGAVLGREFSHELLAAAIDLDEQTLLRGLEELLAAGLLHQRDLAPQTRYAFKHALVCDIAYQSMLKQQQQQRHRQIAITLETRFAERIATQPELLAQHYTGAGLPEQAIPRWQQAGSRAIERSALKEARTHLHKGLELLPALADSETRRQQELLIQTTLGPVLVALEGQAATAVEAAYSRAAELCRQLGETAGELPVLWGLWRYYLNLPDFSRVSELAGQMLALAQRTGKRSDRLIAHQGAGATASFLGAWNDARHHLEQSLEQYDAQLHSMLAPLYGGCDIAVLGLSRLAFVLWALGYPEQALQRNHEALALARRLEQPYSLAYALNFSCLLALRLRRYQDIPAATQELITLSTQQSFAIWLHNGRFFQSWVRALENYQTAPVSDTIDHILIMRRELSARVSKGGELTLPVWLSLIADVHEQCGELPEALAALDEALAVVEKTGEREWLAELYRCKGRLLAKRAQQNQQEDLQQAAVACLLQALETARSQQADMLELRTALTLAQFHHRRGAPETAHSLLAPVYERFTEGFDTADMQDAKALLAR